MSKKKDTTKDLKGSEEQVTEDGNNQFSIAPSSSPNLDFVYRNKIVTATIGIADSNDISNDDKDGTHKKKGAKNTNQTSKSSKRSTIVDNSTSHKHISKDDHLKPQGGVGNGKEIKIKSAFETNQKV